MHICTELYEYHPIAFTVTLTFTPLLPTICVVATYSKTTPLFQYYLLLDYCIEKKLCKKILRLRSKSKILS